MPTLYKALTSAGVRWGAPSPGSSMILIYLFIRVCVLLNIGHHILRAELKESRL